MEVQTVIEEAWTVGHQTVDISLYFPGCPYIMNFCNLTQVSNFAQTHLLVVDEN